MIPRVTESISYEINCRTPEIHGRNETPAHEAIAAQLGQPFGIGDIGLAAGDVFDVMGIDHPHGQSGVLQMGVDALPVDAGALQDDEFDAVLTQPLGQGLEVAFEAAEFAGLFADLAGFNIGSTMRPPSIRKRTSLSRAFFSSPSASRECEVSA